MQEIARVLDKKWKIAQQLRTDSTRTIDQLLGFRDSSTSDQHSHQTCSSPNNHQIISTNILPTKSNNSSMADGTNSLQNQHNHYSSHSNLPLPPPPPVLRCISSNSAIYDMTERAINREKPLPPPPPKRSDTTQLSGRNQIKSVRKIVVDWL